MKRITTILLSGITALAFTACGGGGGSSNDSGGGGDTSIDYSGEYDITVIATTDYGDISACRDGSGELSIDNQYNISGYMLSDWGDYWDVTGDITQSGSVDGGLADAGGGLVADFSGQLTATGGSGNWKDVANCAGTWQANKL